MRHRAKILVSVTVTAVVMPQSTALASRVAPSGGSGLRSRHAAAPAGVRASSAVDQIAPPSLPSPSLDPTGGPTQWFTPTTHSIRNTDGTVSTYLFAGPTYHEVDGRWAQIDPTISAAAPYVAPGAFVPTSFGATSQALATMTLPAGPVTLSSSGLSIGAPALDPASNTLTYPDVAPDTDLELTLTRSGVQMRLALRSADAPHSFSFHLSDPQGALSGGATQQDGSFSFGGPVVDGYHLSIPAPGAYEVTGTPSDAPQPGSVHMTVNPAGDGYDIAETIDGNWLAGKSYPLVVDPDFYWTPGTSTPPADCYMVEATSTTRATSYCNVNQMAIGSNTGGGIRALLQFDTSNLPREATINDAYLGLAFLGEFYGTTSNPVYFADFLDAYSNGQPWDTTEVDGIVTWNRATDHSSWAGTLNCCTEQPGGGDPTGSPDSSCASYGCTISGGSYWQFARITNTVQSWVGGVNQSATADNGVVLTARNQDIAPGNPYGYYWLIGNHNTSGAGCSYSGDPYLPSGSCQPYAYVNYTPLSAPDTPTGFTASPVSPGCVSLSWNASARAASYFVQAYYDSPFALYNTWSPINGTGITLCGLPFHQTFDFYVNAQNDMGASTAAGPLRVTVTGNPPPAPTNVRVAPGDKKVTVMWDAVGQADHYSVSLYDTATGYTGLTATPTTANWVFRGLINERSYYATIQAVNNVDGSSVAVQSPTATPRYTGPDQTEALGHGGDTAMGRPAYEPGADGGGPSTTKLGCKKGQPKCGDPVDELTGNLVEQITDVQVAGRGLGLQFTRTFNGLQAAAQQTPGPLGYGWSGSYAAHLAVDGSGVVTVTQDDGSTITYTPSGSTYTAASWVLASLTHNADGSYTLLTPDGTQYVFSAAGLMTVEQDRNGYLTSLSYSNGRLASAADSAHRSLVFGYDASNRLSTVTDPANRVVRYGYDPAGNLSTVKDPAGNVTTYGYDSNHRLVTVRDPNGNIVLTNTYDSSNRVIAQADALQHTTGFAYSSTPLNPEQTTITRPDGTIITEGFDNGFLISRVVDDSQGQLLTKSSQSYDDSYNITSVTDALGNSTKMTYDDRANVLTVTDPLQRKTINTYDSNNDLLMSKDPSGVLTTFTYDSAGNLLSISTPDSALNNQPSTTTFTYGDGHPGDITAVTDPIGHTTAIAYNTNGDPTVVTDPRGNTTTYHYANAIDWPDTIAGTGQPAVAFTYDNDGRPLTVTDALGRTTHNTYDADGNLTMAVDPKGSTTVYNYDLNSRVISVTTGYGTPEQVTVGAGYDAAGNLTKRTSGNRQVTQYAYNGLGEVTSTTDPDGRTTTYGYDLDGRLTSQSTQGIGSSYGYDAAGQLTGISYSGPATPSVQFDYDADGRRTRMTDGTGTTQYTYDSLGGLRTVDNANGNEVTHGYDLAGNLTLIGYPNGKTVQRTYDAADNLASITDWLGATTSFRYDQHNNLTEIDYPNHVAEQYGYNGVDDLTHIADVDTSVPTVGGSQTVLSGFDYTRDADSQVTHEQLLAPVSGTGPGSAYGYNALNELTTIAPSGSQTSVPGVSCPKITCWLFAGDLPGPNPYRYDPDGNPTQFPDGTTLTYDAADQLTGIGAGGVNAVNLHYNVRGDRTSVRQSDSSFLATYGYDAADRLTQFGAVGVADAQYTYDGDGLRSSENYQAAPEDGVPSTPTVLTFTYDVAEGLPLALTDGIEWYVYGPGGMPIEQIDPLGRTASYFGHDQQGSTRVLMSNTAPTVTGQYNYTPYGTTIGHTGASTSLQYGGQYHDPTGLYYLRARYYDPSTAQFLTRDPVERLNGAPYSYALDNPLNVADPSGLFPCWANPWCEIKKAASAVVDTFKTAYHLGADALAWAEKHSQLLADLGAIGICLAPGVDLVGCGIATAIAFGGRVAGRGISREAALADAVDFLETSATLGLVDLPTSIAAGDAPGAVYRALGVSKSDVTLNQSQLAKQILKLHATSPDAFSAAIHEYEKQVCHASG